MWLHGNLASGASTVLLLSSGSLNYILLIFPTVSLTKTAKKGLESKQKLIEEVNVCTRMQTALYVRCCVWVTALRFPSSYGNVSTPTNICSSSLWLTWGIVNWKTSGQPGNTAGNVLNSKKKNINEQTEYFNFFQRYIFVHISP